MGDDERQHRQIDDAGGEASPVPRSGPSSRCSSPPPPGPRHVRSGSFQRWKKQMQRAWNWGPADEGGDVDNENESSSSSCMNNSYSNCGKNREQGIRSSWNLEMLAYQKRQWYQIQSKTKDDKQYNEPTSLFEHFFIVGLHSYTNVEVIEDAFAKKKSWESEVARSEILDLRKFQRQVHVPTLEPQILFKYPPGKRSAMRELDIPIFCFPEGVKARMLERTPSMSDLNELVFGQVADNATVYGVCLLVQEIVQRAPGILGSISPQNNPSCKSGRFLVSAPRCYCILTKVPFFELHYEMLNSIIAQERLDRITQFVSEMTLTDSAPPEITEHDQLDENFGSPNKQSLNSWMEYAIPADSVLGLASSSIGLLADTEVPLCYRQSEPHSPESVSASENSDFSHVRELDRESRKSWGQFDDYSSVISESRSDSFERPNGSLDVGQTSPDISMIYTSAGHRLEHIGSLESIYS